MTVGRELQFLNQEAVLAHKLAWDIDLDFSENIELTRLQKEQEINEKIVTFGKYITLKHPSPFFEELFQASADLFKTVVEHRLQNPDYYVDSGKPAPYSDKAFVRLENLFKTDDFADEHGKEFAQRELAKYKQDSEYYHRALEYFR